MMHSAFAAMGDPTRRALLERLRLGGPLSLNRLADGLPMTRQAVTRHIDVLRDAGLISMRRLGRERIHELDSAPMREIFDFLAPYAAAWDERLERLASHLEENP